MCGCLGDAWGPWSLLEVRCWGKYPSIPNVELIWAIHVHLKPNYIYNIWGSHNISLGHPNNNKITPKYPKEGDVPVVIQNHL